jgi:hypothetical protein
MNRRKPAFFCVLFPILVFALISMPTKASAASSIISGLSKIDTVASTVPANGDVNPYGVAVVKKSIGNLTKGHILVSNFNNGANKQGTGTTIVDVAPNGNVKLFAQINAANLPGACPGGVGLTTALVALRSGWVIVGSLPTADGTAATAKSGCLIVLDNTGTPVETFYGSLINGPWDMTAADDDEHAKLFFTNVLNGTVDANGQVVKKGTVVRMNLKVSEKHKPWIQAMTVIGSGFPERTDPAALVIGPTGLGLSPLRGDSDADDRGKGEGKDRVLYVADSVNNRIAAIPDALDRTTTAGTGNTLSLGGSLNDPLGLAVAPNGNILTVNGNDGFITEITPQGKQIATKLLDNTGGPPPGNGTLFGLAFVPSVGVYFVDDGSNTLNLLH